MDDVWLSFLQNNKQLKTVIMCHVRDHHKIMKHLSENHHQLKHLHIRCLEDNGNTTKIEFSDFSILLHSKYLPELYNEALSTSCSHSYIVVTTDADKLWMDSRLYDFGGVGSEKLNRG